MHNRRTIGVQSFRVLLFFKHHIIYRFESFIIIYGMPDYNRLNIIWKKVGSWWLLKELDPWRNYTILVAVGSLNNRGRERPDNRRMPIRALIIKSV